MAEEQSTSTLERLTTEIQDMIIYQLDPQSVMNLCLTGPVFRDKILGDENMIVKRVIQQSIGEDLLPLAIARFQAHSARTWLGQTSTRGLQNIREAVQELEEDIKWLADLCDYYLKGGPMSREIPSVMRRLKTAREVVCFHEAVCYYADSLAKEAARRGNWDRSFDSPTPTHTPSSSEIARFRKALYIMELSRDMWSLKIHIRDPHLFKMLRECWHYFWRCFAPWENQQVRCVQEMLQRHLCRAFQPGYVENYVIGPMVRRDISSVPRWDLARLRSMEQQYVDATPLEGYMEGGDVPWSLGPTTWYTRGEKLWLNPVSRGKFSPDISHILDSFGETDTGPADAWYHGVLARSRVELPILRPMRIQTHCHGHRFECYYCSTMWGYVFWDRQTLDTIHGGIFDMPTMEEMRSAAVHPIRRERFAPTRSHPCECRRRFLEMAARDGMTGENTAAFISSA
ncbi:hypothetical protein F4778DRAFT_753291 [Xylariomycetidae sp. FL2044]|nr:hypothetical protein F4778DRAFT_753291 [Xylariomycetidae sp. FL2044]